MQHVGFFLSCKTWFSPIFGPILSWWVVGPMKILESLLGLFLSPVRESFLSNWGSFPPLLNPVTVRLLLFSVPVREANNVFVKAQERVVYFQIQNHFFYVKGSVVMVYSSEMFVFLSQNLCIITFAITHKHEKLSSQTKMKVFEQEQRNWWCCNC